MTSFLQKLKVDISDIRNQAGMQRKVTVDAGALLQFLEDYEKLDAHFRSDHIRAEYHRPEECVETAVKDYWHSNNYNSFKAVEFVVSMLQKFEDEKPKLAQRR